MGYRRSGNVPLTNDQLDTLQWTWGLDGFVEYWRSTINRAKENLRQRPDERVARDGVYDAIAAAGCLTEAAGAFTKALSSDMPPALIAATLSSSGATATLATVTPIQMERVLGYGAFDYPSQVGFGELEDRLRLAAVANAMQAVRTLRMAHRWYDQLAYKRAFLRIKHNGGLTMIPGGEVEGAVPETMTRMLVVPTDPRQTWNERLWLPAGDKAVEQILRIAWMLSDVLVEMGQQRIYAIKTGQSAMPPPQTFRGVSLRNGTDTEFDAWQDHLRSLPRLSIPLGTTAIRNMPPIMEWFREIDGGRGSSS